MSYRIRPGLPEEAASLAALECAALRPFAEFGMAEIAEVPPDFAPGFREAAEAGRLWVIEDAGGRAAGLAVAKVYDGQAYLAEVSVHPDHAGRRLGQRLIEVVEDWAVSAGYREVTLTTFRDVPWNGPYYLRLGFDVVEESALGPDLLAQRCKEQTRGLDKISPRVAMKKRLGEG